MSVKPYETKAVIPLRTLEARKKFEEAQAILRELAAREINFAKFPYLATADIMIGDVSFEYMR